jgi:hypothetical protein
MLMNANAVYWPVPKPLGRDTEPEAAVGETVKVATTMVAGEHFEPARMTIAITLPLTFEASKEKVSG